MIYTIIQETEKAIKVKYPYYKVSGEFDKKHTQKYVEQWIPKSISNIEMWVHGKMRERGFDMTFLVLGIAPVKIEIEPMIVPDSDKIQANAKVFYDKVFALTGLKPHHRSGFDADEAYFEIDGKVFDFGDEYVEMKKYKPTISIKRYK